MMNVQWVDWALVRECFPRVLQGLGESLKITGLSFSIGLTGGCILAGLQVYGPRLIRWLVILYTTVFRGTPMMVQIAFFYFFLPYIGINLSAFLAACLAIGLNSSAYISQIVRAGILGIKKDELQAAIVLGFSPWQRFRLLVLPQALRKSLPSLTNESITLLKDSSLASSIGVYEVYKELRDVLNQTYDVISVFGLLIGVYLIMTTLLSILAMWLEKRYAFD